MTHSEMVLANLKRKFCALANNEKTRWKSIDPEDILRIICEMEADAVLGKEDDTAQEK